MDTRMLANPVPADRLPPQISAFCAKIRIMSTAAGMAPGSAEPRGFKRLWRVLKQLFYEVVGALFAILAFAWLNYGFRAWTRDVAYWLIATTFAVALIFVFFAVSSFRRARSL
jgi:hypothetical protein